MADPRTLNWTDLSDVATSAFDIWADQPELEWAKNAWQYVIQAGLANYSTELQRCQAAIRFLALAGIYHDFCEYAFEESSSAQWRYGDWADNLEISAFRIGQLIGRHFDWDDDEDDPDECQSNALTYLVNSERSCVFSALVVGFKDSVENPVNLFISLWRSRNEKVDSEEDDPMFETDDDIVNDATPQKLAAFEWLTQGCP